MKQTLVLLTLAWNCVSSSLAFADGIEKWFYAYVDLLRDPVLSTDDTSYTTKQLIALFPVLKEHGYSVIVLSSYQLGSKVLADTPARPARTLGNLGSLRFSI